MTLVENPIDKKVLFTRFILKRALMEQNAVEYGKLIFFLKIPMGLVFKLVWLNYIKC